MTKTWEETTQTDFYKDLSPNHKEKARTQYFDEVVSLKVPVENREAARNQFYDFDDGLRTDEDKAGFNLKDVGKAAWDATGMLRRAGGVAMGVLNSPVAFYWGGMSAPLEDPAQWAEMSEVDKTLVSFGRGFEDAWRGITKKGDFGTMAGEYWKEATGETFSESLPKGLKWAAPFIEFFGNVGPDPLFHASTVASLAKFQVPKQLMGKLPKNLLDDVAKLNALEGQEKAVIHGKLAEVLNRRVDYMRWWQKKLPEFEQAAFNRGQKMLPAGEDFAMLPQGKAIKQLTSSFEMPKALPSPNRLGIPVGKSMIPVEQQVTDTARRIEVLSRKIDVLSPTQRKELTTAQKKFKTLLHKDVIRKGSIVMGEDPARMEAYVSAAKTPDRKAKEFASHFIVNPKVSAVGLEKPIARLGLEISEMQKKLKTADVRSMGTFELEKELSFKVGKLETYKKTVEDSTRTMLENARKLISLDDPVITKQVLKDLGPEYKPMHNIMLHSSGGAVAGVEVDEDGNISYSPAKGAAGMVLGVAGLKLRNKKVRDFAKVLAKNPAWSRVHGMVGSVRKQPFSLMGMLGKVNTTMFDRFSRLKGVSKEAYDEAIKFSSNKDVAQLEFQKLVDSFQPIKKNEAVFTDYVLAHRAMDRAKRGIENPNSVTLAEARQAIADMEGYYTSTGGNINDLKQSLSAFKNWSHDNILLPAKENGIISEKNYDSITKNNEWYATFNVLDKLPADINKIPDLPGGEFFSVANQRVVKGMKGTERLIDDPIEATVSKFMGAQDLFARNKVASVLIDGGMEKGFARRVAMNEKEYAAFKKSGLDPVMNEAWDKKEFEVINRFKDGMVERYLFNKEIAETVKQLSPKQAPRVVMALNRLFTKAATTAYLPFTITNSFRDALMAYTTAPVFTAGRVDKFAAQWAKGFWNAAKLEFMGSNDLAEQYLKHGGGFGFVGELRNAKQSKKLLFEKGLIDKASDIITSPFALLEKISTTIELAPRLGTFDMALAKGFSSKDAALMARKATIDFSRGGTWTKVANQWAPFLNARVQSKVIYGEALAKSPKETLAKTFTSVVVPAMGTYAWNRLHYSKEYEDIPRHIRDNYFVIITGIEEKDGKKTPNYVVIPKGDVGQLAWNPIEFALDKMMGKDRETTTAFLISHLSDISPIAFEREGEISPSLVAGSMMPPVVKGFAEDWANLKFYTGREIVPYHTKKNKPPELQYHENTPESYKWLGEKLGIAPLRLQNFASNLLAGYGREGLDPSAMMRGLTGRLLKTTSGEINNQAWTDVKDMEQGYLYTRAYAEELVKNGKRSEATELLNTWNKNLSPRIKEFNDKFKKYDIKDKGGLMKSYRFNRQKRKSILLSGRERGDALERRLRRRR